MRSTKETSLTKTDAAQSIKDRFPKLATPAASAPAFTPKIEAPAHGAQSEFADTEMVILPDPVGYHMLIALPTFAEQTASGVYIPDEVNQRERTATVVGTVLAMGEDCYKDLKRFPAGKPWCKVGDKVLFSRYSGMRFRSKDIESGGMVEYRMLSDDNIVGTVPQGAEVGGL